MRGSSRDRALSLVFLGQEGHFKPQFTRLRTWVHGIARLETRTDTNTPTCTRCRGNRDAPDGLDAGCSAHRMVLPIRRNVGHTDSASPATRLLN